MTRALRSLGTLVVVAFCGGCLDDTVAVGTAHSPGGGAIDTECRPGELLVAVAGDYQVTDIAVFDLVNMRRLASGFLHSGTAVGATGAALSGDVVLGSRVGCSADVIDRASGVVTRVRLGDGTAPTLAWQADVSGGFFSNIQDFINWSGGMTVVRAQRDPLAQDPGSASGDDLLTLDAATRKPIDRLDLGPHATLPHGLAFGGRAAAIDGIDGAGEELWVPLVSPGAGFATMGSARVVGVHRPQAGGPLTVAHVVNLPAPLRNCAVVRSSYHLGSPSREVVVLCAGFFKSTAQTVESGIAVIDTAASPPSVRLTVSATATDAAFFRPLFGDVSCGADRCFVIAIGDTASGRTDEAWEFPIRGGGKPRLVQAGGAAFAMTGLYYDAARERLWIADASRAEGDVVVLSCPKIKGSATTSTPTGPPCQPVASLRGSRLGLPALTFEGP